MQNYRHYRRYHQRLCLEAWHVNSAHAPLNRGRNHLHPKSLAAVQSMCLLLHHLENITSREKKLSFGAKQV